LKIKKISFRTQLKGSISDFLEKEKMRCPDTENGLLELVVALSHYTEEGSFLFPEIIICDDLESTLRLLQCSDPIPIGEGFRSPKTILQAIKRCAPLAQENWKIYIFRFEQCFEYGIFRAPYTPTALSIRDTIQALSEEQQDFHIIYASQIAEKSVELIGTCSGSLQLYLSAMSDDEPSPNNYINLLVKVACSDVEQILKEQTESYLKTILINALQHSHGTLIGVLGYDQLINRISTDGVTLSSKIDLSNLVATYENQRSDQSLSLLISYGKLLSGMVASDGIVILDTKCNLRGYNLFVKDRESLTLPQSILIGGARRRAYSTLCSMVDKNLIRACFFQSGDGSSEFHCKD
jgi:hypothetical protein